MLPHKSPEKRSKSDTKTPKTQPPFKKNKPPASEQTTTPNWKSVPSHIVQSFFGYLPSLRDQGRASLTCKSWHQAGREITDHALNSIASKFCFFFAPELLLDLEKVCEKNKSLLIKNKLFEYINCITNPDLRELTKAVIFSDANRIKFLLKNRFSANIAINILDLPKTRTEILSLNLCHFAAIFANCSAMSELITTLDIKEDIPHLNTTHHEYRKISYNLFDLALLAGNFEILETTFSCTFSKFIARSDYVEEFSYCASVLALDDGVFSVFDKNNTMEVFLKFIIKNMESKAINAVIPGTDNFVVFYSLLDWAVNINNNESLQWLLDNEYFLSIDWHYGEYPDGPGYDDYLKYNDGKGREIKSLLGIDGSLIRGFCKENVFQALCYHNDDLIDPNINRFGDRSRTLLRALNLAIHIHNQTAVKAILDCYQNRAKQDSKTYPHAGKIHNITITALQQPIPEINTAKTKNYF